MPVRTERRGPVQLITLDRPDRRNAVDGPMAEELAAAFGAFAEDDGALVAVVTGAGGTFCAGNDLKAMAAGEFPAPTIDGPPPMAVTWTERDKPVIAAIEGYCFGGGFELALWCDLRVASATAEFGALNLEKGLPCLDGATVRLPRIVGQGHALDILLSARRVTAPEALRIGLATRLVDEGKALEIALDLAERLASIPAPSLRAVRRSVLAQWDFDDTEAALEYETALALGGDTE